MWSSVTDRLTSWTKLLRGPQRGGGAAATADVDSPRQENVPNANNQVTNSSIMKESSSSSSELSPLMDQQDINETFRQHLTELEHFVINEVEVDQLERWLIRATRLRQKKVSESASTTAASVKMEGDGTAAAMSAAAAASSTVAVPGKVSAGTSHSYSQTSNKSPATANTNTHQSTSTNKNGRKTSLSRWKFCVHADKRQMLQELTRSLQLRPTKVHVLWELASCISSAVAGDGFRLYIAENGDPDRLHLHQQTTEEETGGLGLAFPSSDVSTEDLVTGPCASATSAASAVARTRVPLRLTRDELASNYQDSLPTPPPAAHHILVHPMVQPDGQLAAVLEVWRPKSGSPFHEEEEEIATSYLVWGGIALHYAHLYLSINKQRRLNEFLLAVVKSIFQDMVSMDALVLKVMNFAQRLVDADRASLFLVDSHSRELYARIFDVGSEDMAAAAAAAAVPADGCHTHHGSPPTTALHHGDLVNKPKEIRFPLGTGIAGQVALTGEVLNIADAYLDPRFNRSIDQLTGYHTRTILCMPIFIRNHVIGVVQMVNKRAGAFNKEDEESFEMFAIYCGLALHHAKLYDKIARSEQKYRVALDVLSYHNTCSEAEVSKAQERGLPRASPGLDDYYFTPFGIDDFEKARQAVCMFTDLFGLATFERENLYRFILTVKKNYRRVPYHNWTHGFNVANCMYAVLKRAKGIFSRNERLALFVGSLCHDLDHRGKNNKFMSDTESPLAAIYTTSTMEHHHFNQTVTILQQKGHNIFSHLTSDDYKEVLGHLKHCILATDLALFFPNRRRLTELVTTQDFNWTNRDHRLLLEAITMTASDLSASAKPWPVQVETVKVIFEEFYEQGDAERAAGRTPLPMMDRSQPDQQAASQVGFLMGICLPCYRLLHQLIPETKPLLDQCQSNLERWMALDAETKSNGPQLRLRIQAAATTTTPAPTTTIQPPTSPPPTTTTTATTSNTANGNLPTTNEQQASSGISNNNNDNDEDEDDEAIIAESRFRGLGRLDEPDLITPPIE